MDKDTPELRKSSASSPHSEQRIKEATPPKRQQRPLSESEKIRKGVTPRKRQLLQTCTVKISRLKALQRKVRQARETSWKAILKKNYFAVQNLDCFLEFICPSLSVKVYFFLYQCKYFIIVSVFCTL